MSEEPLYTYWVSYERGTPVQVLGAGRYRSHLDPRVPPQVLYRLFLVLHLLWIRPFGLRNPKSLTTPLTLNLYDTLNPEL